jgi:hypothetical protein
MSTNNNNNKHNLFESCAPYIRAFLLHPIAEMGAPRILRSHTFFVVFSILNIITA